MLQCTLINIYLYTSVFFMIYRIRFWTWKWLILEYSCCMKWLLKCYYGYRNRGDEVLFFGVVKYVFEHYEGLTQLDVEVGDVSWMYEWCERNYDLWQEYKSRVRFVPFRRFSMWIADYDMIFAGGGEVLAQKGRSPRRAGVNYLALFWRWIWTRRVVRLWGIETPTVWWSKVLYRMMLPYAYEVVCREQWSYTIAKRYTDRVVLYHDWAIDILSEESKRGWRDLKSKNRQQVWKVEDQRSEEQHKYSIDQKTQKIIGCAIEVHKRFADTITESQIKHILYDKLVEQWFTVQKEVPLKIIDNGKNYGNRYLDLLVDWEIVLELKKTSFKQEVEKAFRQTRNYLDLWNYPSWLLLNFWFSTTKINRFNNFKSLPISFDLWNSSGYVLINFIPKYTTPEIIAQFHEWIQGYPDHQIINFPAEEWDILPEVIRAQYGDRITTRQRREHDIASSIDVFQQADAGFGQRLHFIIPCVYLGVAHYHVTYSEKISKILEFFASSREDHWGHL